MRSDTFERFRKLVRLVSFPQFLARFLKSTAKTDVTDGFCAIYLTSRSNTLRPGTLGVVNDSGSFSNLFLTFFGRLWRAKKSKLIVQVDAIDSANKSELSSDLSVI